MGHILCIPVINLKENLVIDRPASKFSYNRINIIKISDFIRVESSKYLVLQTQDSVKFVIRIKSKKIFNEN